jgi:hypothetical protein
VSGGIPGIPVYDTFQSKLAELRNAQDLKYLGSIWPVNEHPDFGGGTGDDYQPPFINDPTFLTKASSGFAPFFYEAAIALGLAACSASEEEESFTGPNHYEHWNS